MDQWVERQPTELEIAGSSLARGSSFFLDVLSLELLHVLVMEASCMETPSTPHKLWPIVVDALEKTAGWCV